MFDNETFDPSNAPVPTGGDAEIVEKFRAWCAARREVAMTSFASEAAFDAAQAPQEELEDALFQIPASGALGLAVKTYIRILHNDGGEDDPRAAGLDPCSLPPKLTSGHYDDFVSWIIRDIAALAPELAPLCSVSTVPRGAPGEAPIGAADGEVEAILAEVVAAREDLAAIIARRGELSLAELIAAERRAWAHPIRETADQMCFAWRRANPKLAAEIGKDDENLPEPIGALYRAANQLAAVANRLTDLVVTSVPGNLDDAIRLIEFDVDHAEAEKIYPGLLTGLRAIASAAA